jgi:cytidylate kinase
MDGVGEPSRGIYWISGVMAAGKSTVADLLAQRFGRGVHVRGDDFRRMIVAGQVQMVPGAPPEAEAQLRLRYELAAAAADRYFGSGFSVVVQDVVLGEHLALLPELVRGRPLYVVVLAPRLEVIESRETGRPKDGYGSWTADELDALLRRETPRLGLWIDSSDQTADETVDEIVRRAANEADMGT